MALMRYDPFRDLDRFTEQFFSGARSRTMPMEAFRRGDEFYVFLDLPGVAGEDIELTVERNVVSIRAERRSPRQEGDQVIVDERPQGTFTRQLFLGDNLEANQLSAEYERGVLRLVVPVSEASKPRRIEVASEPGETQPIESGPSKRAETRQDAVQPAGTSS